MRLCHEYQLYSKDGLIHTLVFAHQFSGEATVVSHIYTYDRAQNILNFVQPVQNLIL